MPRNKYQHRPLWVSSVNRLGALTGAAARVSLDAGDLVAAAVRSAKLTEFGPGNWGEGLTRLCAALDGEARLNTIGRLSARRHLLQLLCNRLHIEAARRRDARIGAQQIVAPVVITGLPRSGSTLLHGLLAQDPQVRVPWTWEVMLPGIPPETPSATPDARRRRTASMLRWVHRLAPAFRAVHPVDAELPQECIAITAHAFASVEFHTTFDVTSYQRWLDRDERDDGIRYHRRFLQHLQAAGGSGRWFLKAPAHLYDLPALSAVYPDARYVYTRREPREVAASIASHGVILRNAFSDDVDTGAVAEDWMKWWAEGWRRGEAFRAAGHAAVDVEYRRLVADPVGAVRELYDALDLCLDETTAARMRAFLAANPQDKHGRHRYTMSEFGLTSAAIEASFNG